MLSLPPASILNRIRRLTPTATMNNAQLELYGTDGCHLCEEAAALLQALSIPARHIDIAGDDHLLDRYGVRIPVLRRSDGAELNWPFGSDEILRFVDAD